MVSVEFEIKALDRAEFIRKGKPLPFELMNEEEQLISLEKQLIEDKEKSKGRLLNPSSEYEEEDEE